MNRQLITRHDDTSNGLTGSHSYACPPLLRQLRPHLGQHRLSTRQIGVADRFVNGDDLFQLDKGQPAT